MLDEGPEKARELLADLQADTTDALENLRDLARGIYPPLLADKGLVAALEAQARKSPRPGQVRHDGVGRFPQDVEAARLLLHARGVAEHRRSTRRPATVEVGLAATDGQLRFQVA